MTSLGITDETRRPRRRSAALFEGCDIVHGRAWLLGERIDLRALERAGALTSTPVTTLAGQRGCAVFFRYGALVTFELEPAEEAALLETLRPLVTAALDEPEREEIEIRIAPDERERVDASGIVHLRAPDLERLQIVAEVLAKSVLLAAYEERVAEVFDRIEPLALTLRSGGRRARSRELLRQIADVLLIQTRTVGRAEVGEKPELTWDDPELDRLYERLRVEYELSQRDHALERKLELITRTAETLLELLQNRSGLRLEWYIVILIAVEIVIIVYDIFWHL